MTFPELVNLVGGNAAFHREFGVPLSTIEGWKSGKRIAQYHIDNYYELWRLRRK